MDRPARRVAAPHALPLLTSPVSRLTFDSDYDAVLSVKTRRDRLDAAIEQMAAGSEFTPLVRRLGCLRGISSLTGLALAVEIGDCAPVQREQHRIVRRTRARGVIVWQLPQPGTDHQDR